MIYQNMSVFVHYEIYNRKTRSCLFWSPWSWRIISFEIYLAYCNVNRKKCCIWW